MDLRFALLADHVAETREGKLVIVGEFNAIRAPNAPVTHSRMFLVARLEARVTEGSQHRLRIALVDEDGNHVIPASPEIPIDFVPTSPGHPLVAQVIVGLENIRFPHFGDYEFHLLVDGRLLADVPLTVAQVLSPPGRK